MLASAALEPRVMVDCSHAQTSKDYTKQPAVLQALVDQVCAGSDAIILIQIDNVQHNLPAGLVVTGGNTTIRGLSITGFSHDTSVIGVRLAPPGSGNTVEGNFIGLAPDGSTTGSN